MGEAMLHQCDFMDCRAREKSMKAWAYKVVIPCTCARGKVIGPVLIVVMDTIIAKSGDLGT